MNFPYRSYISDAPDGDGFIELLRPVVKVSVAGPAASANCIGLVDTGADHTILPKSLAEELGIAIQPAAGAPASVFGGQPVQLWFGDAKLSIFESDEIISWAATVFFYDSTKSENEMVILGHTGFLDYFTATFDGKVGVLTLIPNDELPGIG
jgi:hypothetical protein